MSKFSIVEESYNSCIAKPKSYYLRHNLLMALTDWLIACAREKQPQEIDRAKVKGVRPGLKDVPNESFVKLMDFTHMYPTICYPGTLASCFTKDHQFFEWCGLMERGSYKIQPKKALSYLSIYGPPRIKVRAIEILQKEGESD